ncbi:hypothetical protein M569_06090 [Genlisea aurea]|uniref:Uncharacterized protein n=1 Tax=Genlisea aurea TaxID=192259 RepID=S8CUW0_9LAMI|nr:hypothetical protein M569_06090 [Genlisea aurea]
MTTRSQAPDRPPTLLNNPAIDVPRLRRTPEELAGQTAADCVAICCCVPCCIFNAIALAVYKIPVGLARKVRTVRRRRRLRERKCVSDDEQGGASVEKLPELSQEAAELDNEMREKFKGGGFWRRPSPAEISERDN